MGKTEQSQSDEKIFVMDDDYAIQSRIANNKGIITPEGYPVIRRGLYELNHLDPDESEYSAGDLNENDAMYIYAAGEGYAIHRRRRKKENYD